MIPDPKSAKSGRYLLILTFSIIKKHKKVFLRYFDSDNLYICS